MAPTFFTGRKLEGKTKNWLTQNGVNFGEYPLIQIDVTIEAAGNSVKELFIQKEHYG